MIRRVFVIIAAASLLPALLAASASASPASAMLSGRIAVEGKLTGPPSLGGVRLALYAEPSQPVMNKLRFGDRVQGKLVGVAYSSSAGAYAIRVSHSAAITSSAFNGVVNFEVWADGHGYWTVFGFVRKIGAGDALLPLFGSATTAPMQATLIMERLSKHDAAISPATMDGDCWVLAPNGDLGPVKAKLEGLWSTISGVHKYLSYTDDATSSVSIGVSVDDGPWVSGQDGNTSVTETGGGQDFPEVTGKTSRIGETEMEEGFFETCEISTEYATFPYAVDGGTYYLKSNPPKATHCVHELKGSTLRMKKTESYTFSDGINLGSTFGISLAATTGYSQEAEIKYVYSATAWACGTKSYPLRDTAHGVVADATIHGNR
jgi:hypothetical protein